MWTNKQVWEFEQINENLKFNLLYLKPEQKRDFSWASKMSYPNSEIRDTIVKTFDHLADGYDLIIANSDKDRIQPEIIPYVMAVIVDTMVDEEICLNFKIENNCLVASIDTETDVIDCKEFFEEFYHLATGFNYDTDTGIPSDQTEAEIYLTRLQEEFDERMKRMLGDKYLPGNNDPDTLNSK